MEILPLSEGKFTIDQTKVFVPFNSDTDVMKDRSPGSLLVEIQPFLVITSTDKIILDTGLGFKNEQGQMQIHQNLSAHGIRPEDITIVLLSHLHKDHAGGIADKAQQKLSFPNAVYYVAEKELEYAIEKGTPSYHIEDFEILKANNKVKLLTGDKGTFGDISYVVSGGHCPFHTVYWIKDGNEIVFFGGDVAPQLQQLKTRFSAKYDFDGKKSMELRSEWWQESETQHWKFLFYHDIKTPLYAR